MTDVLLITRLCQIPLTSSLLRLHIQHNYMKSLISFWFIIFCTDMNSTSLYEYLQTLTLFWTVPGKWDKLKFNYVALCKSEAFLPGRKQYRPLWRGAGTVPLAFDIGNICYCSLNTIRVIKSRRMRRAGHITRMGERRGIYGILVRKTEGKRPLGRSRRRWNDNPLRWIFRKWDGGYGLDRSGSG